jgi:hypothetical protein
MRLKAEVIYFENLKKNWVTSAYNYVLEKNIFQKYEKVYSRAIFVGIFN